MILDAAALLLALLGMPLALGAVRLLGGDALSWKARALLWGVASCVLVLLVFAAPQRSLLQEIGAGRFDVQTIYWGLGGAVVVLGSAGAVVTVQRLLGLPFGDRENFAQIASRPLPLRLFLVTTAAVLEELLYRGVGVGVGASLLGSELLAGAVSLLAFALGHARWKLAHLPAVAVSGGALTALFVTSGDVWACVLAHFLVDAIGMIVVPAIMSARNTRQ